MADLRLNGLNPLAYMGVRAYTPPALRVFKNQDPTPQDNQNFKLGDLWLNQTSEQVWILVSLSQSVAEWVLITGGGTVETLTGNSGGAVGPTTGNINVLGDGTTVNIVGDPGTSTLTASTTGAVATSYLTDSGSAVPAAGVLTVHGGHDVNTSGSGSTVTINVNNAITLGDLATIPVDTAALTCVTGDILIEGNLSSPTTTYMIRFPSSNIISFFLSNVFIGSGAGNVTMTPSDALNNIGIGTSACSSLTTGSQNTVVGQSALASLTTGSTNIAIGYSAGSAMTSSETGNTLVGYAGVAGTTGLAVIGFSGVHLPVFHNYPGNNASTANGGNVFVGGGSGNFTLTGSGSNAGNSGLGSGTLHNLTSGTGNDAQGAFALNLITTGSNNVGVGHAAGFNSLIPSGLTTGSFNTLIGFEAGMNYTGAESNNIMINNFGVVGESNVCRIGAATGSGMQQLTQTFIAGIRGTTTVNNDAVAVLVDSAGQLGTVSSSLRYKENVRDMEDLSESIFALRPVIFNYKDRDAEDTSIGLIAEEVAEVLPSLVVYDKMGKPDTVKYQDLPVLLLNELIRQQLCIENLYERIELLEESLRETTVN